jgi:mannose-6-phosphate isomerase-like protein (cupin superfamily)
VSGGNAGQSSGLTLIAFAAVESRTLTRFVHFSPDGVHRETVFETEHLWSQILCFERNQSLGPVMDPQADAMFTIVAGEAAFQVEGDRKRLKQWGSVLVPAGSEVTITNASVDPLVLLLVAAPPPEPRQDDSTG